MGNSNAFNPAIDKAISLFDYIEELNKLRVKTILNVSEHKKCCYLKDLMDDPENIQISYRDRTDEDETGNDSSDLPPLLAIHRPEFEACPTPPDILREWLEDGWQDYHFPAKVYDYLERQAAQAKEKKNDGSTSSSQPIKESFASSPARQKAFAEWNERRNLWQMNQKRIGETRARFSRFYDIYNELEEESETEELIVADGFVRDRNNHDIDHPILLKRVMIDFDPKNYTIYINDSDAVPLLYEELFQETSDLHIESISTSRTLLREQEYHPLDRVSLPTFFKTFINQLSSKSRYSEEGVPLDWKKQDRLLLYRNPCFILREKPNGVIKTTEDIKEDIRNRQEVPGPIVDFTGEGERTAPKDPPSDDTLEKRLAAVGGESPDILLSKEANKEQLEIARRIEQYNAVLVQGPPGTGKTHTIANLTGHFLAQGKTVLITSQTPKALSVLHNKLPKEIQSLCVAVTENSTKSIQQSVEDIVSYQSSTTAARTKAKMVELSAERASIIKELAKTRKALYSIINQQANNIVINGESISPAQAAAKVQEGASTLSYIPGKVSLQAPLPLTRGELDELYQSNAKIDQNDELEMSCDLPDPQNLLSPQEFTTICQQLINCDKNIEQLKEKHAWKISEDSSKNALSIKLPEGRILVPVPDSAALTTFKKQLPSLPNFEEWMIQCAVDGYKGQVYRKRWDLLTEKVKELCEKDDELVGHSFGKTVEFLAEKESLKEPLKDLEDVYKKGNTPGFFRCAFNSKLKVAIQGVTINGNKPSSEEDCRLALTILDNEGLRKECAVYWDELMTKNGAPAFNALSPEKPEEAAQKYIPLIQNMLDWFKNDYVALKETLQALEISPEMIFPKDALDTELSAAQKIFSIVRGILPSLYILLASFSEKSASQKQIGLNIQILQEGNRIRSKLAEELVQAQRQKDPEAYQQGFSALAKTYSKLSMQAKRDASLKKIAAVAPEWANAIQKREGIHGKDTVPETIEDAWKWKQYAGIIEEINEEPFADLQKKSIDLSKRYRQTTAKYASACAWYHLLIKVESNLEMQQALQGWSQTIHKIGKGTGKNAPIYMRKARKLMAQCQKAVPAWIMPISKALETLDPAKNKFDIVIIDEASQADVSALAILYFGKKLIIVGDDKQVSPMAVGIQMDKIQALIKQYLGDKIPNAHLYDPKTSIYDLAKTTFSPLMLREHFRCVPEIISFSNDLSYEGKIKPLREAGDTLLPAVVNYRVANGRRDETGKRNPMEARTIAALMKACIMQPEYKGKTFGVISLLGDEQVALLQEEIAKAIDFNERHYRKILCGNAANFQGDERDVIFLSMVDSGTGNGPLRLMGNGPNETNKKRYNVAASRAKDQLWVVDSLDPANDLKSGDLRKQLIEFSLNPKTMEERYQDIKNKADSPFEVSVAKALVDRGYHIVQQWPVGAYRIDMVAIYQSKRIAIECDGERYHSGEEKIREDMERQAILERLGWRFIRIRGSEFFRDQKATIERLIHKLDEAGIKPEESRSISPADRAAERNTDLLQRVKIQAFEILNDKNDPYIEDQDAIGAALDPKNDVIGTKEVPPPQPPVSVKKGVLSEQSTKKKG